MLRSEGKIFLKADLREGHLGRTEHYGRMPEGGRFSESGDGGEGTL